MSDRAQSTDALAPTPGQTVGPFFHYALPYERGHQLVPPGSPGSVRLHGVVYDGHGVPIPDALIEVRQADPRGRVPEVEGSLHRDGGAFTGWGRVATDTVGRYSFTTVEPGASAGTEVPFFSVVLLARGLLNRLFTRIYLPPVQVDADPLLASLPPERRSTLIASREGDGVLRFDIHLQGDAETVFLAFPGHGSP